MSWRLWVLVAAASLVAVAAGIVAWLMAAAGETAEELHGW